MKDQLILNKNCIKDNFKKINKNNSCTIYKFKNNEGMGVITKYKLSKGIEVFFNNIHLSKISYKIYSKKESFEINHCKEGRFECTLKDGTVTYMKSGDFAINPVKNQSKVSVFPIEYYYGVTIHIIPSELNEEGILLEKIFNVNYRKILSKLCYGDKLFIKRATVEIQHIFYEIYNVPENIIFPYLKVKIQELFLYLSSIDPKIEFSDREYFTKSNIDIVKNIHKYIKKI